MAIEVIKKRYPILDGNKQSCTFPTFASQVFGDGGDNRALWQDGRGFYADDSAKLGGRAPSYYTWTDNLLLNSNFCKPYLINLNGKTEYSTHGEEAANGWIIGYESTMSISDNGITVTGYVRHRVNLKAGTYTYVVCETGGGKHVVTFNFSGADVSMIVGSAIIYAVYEDDHVEIGINSGSFAWAYLVEGSYTAETLSQPHWLHPRLEMMRMGLPMNPVNLLDNSDFTNLIAQAGYPAKDSEGNWISGLHGTRVYLADRWYQDNQNLDAPTYDEASRIITFPNVGSPNPIKQKVSSNISGKVVTLAIKASNVTGNIHLSESNSLAGHQDKRIENGITLYSYTAGDNAGVLIWSQHGGTITIDWIALYEGEYTADTLPPYRPKGYGAELAECMRYYQNWKRYETVGYVTGAGMSYCMPIYLDVPMRICPSVTGTPIWGARVAAGGYSKYTSSDNKGFTKIVVYTADSKDVSWLYICDELTSAGGDTNNSVLAYRIVNLELSADL